MAAQTDQDDSLTQTPAEPTEHPPAPIIDSLIPTDASKGETDTIPSTELTTDTDNMGQSASGDSIFSVNFANTQPVPPESGTTPHTLPTSTTQTPAEVPATVSSITGSTDSYIMVSDSTPSPPQTISDAQTEPQSKPDPAPPQPPEWLDVLGNGSLKKLIIESGEGQQPGRGQRVLLEFTGRLGGMEGQVVEQENGLEVEVGDGEVVQGMDLTLPLMMQGELAWLYMESRFGYGDMGNGADIPPGAELFYLVRLREVHSKYDYANLTEEKLAELVERKKTRGNNLYKMNQLTQAITAYQSAIGALECHQYSATPEGRTTGCRILTNLAITQYKHDYKQESLASCDKALSLLPGDTKALYRKSVILTERHEYAEALACLEEALRSWPEDRVVEQELRRVRELRDQSNRRQRNVYRRMIQGHTSGKEEEVKGNGGRRRGVFAAIIASSIVAVAAVCVGLLVFKRN